MVTVLKTVVAQATVGSNPTPSVYPERVKRVEGPMLQSWFFYTVRCVDGSLYCGITNNLDKRMKKHNAGTGAKYTRNRRPVVLVYTEKYDGISRARKREEQVKHWSRIKKEQLISGSLS